MGVSKVLVKIVVKNGKMRVEISKCLPKMGIFLPNMGKCFDKSWEKINHKREKSYRKCFSKIGDYLLKKGIFDKRD